jgi:hypothetical protein
MYRNKLTTMTAAAIAAGVATASCAAAASASGTTGTAGKPVTTAHLLIWSVNSDGPYFQEVVTGAVGDYGKGETVLPDGTIDPEHTSQLQMNMTHGSFRLSIAAIGRGVVDTERWQWNKANCSGRVSFRAQAPVVAGSGTGDYRGITGTFDVTVTIEEVDVKPVCNGTSGFLSQLILLDGTGSVSY